MKILHDQGEKQKAEFLHEASILKGLRHPNVVDYFGLAFSEKDEVCRKRLPFTKGSIHRAMLLQGSKYDALSHRSTLGQPAGSQ